MATTTPCSGFSPAESGMTIPLEVVRWPLARLGELAMRDEVSDGRAIAALFIAREWLAAQR